MRASRSLRPAALLAGLLLAAMPAHAQLGDMLGDSDVTGGSGSGMPGDRRAAGERRADRREPRERTVRIAPYLELDQTALVNLKGGDGDVLTYTTVAAGVQANIETHTVQIGADLRYAHLFSWNDDFPDQDVISGIATGRVELVRDRLSLEAGGLATRVRADGLTGANGSLIGAGYTNQVYSAYVGPNLTVPLGDVQLNGFYRLGYNRVDQDNDLPPDIALPASSFDESWFHHAFASVGQQPNRGLLPFGWSVGAGYLRENASQLSQHFIDKYVRADITVPVSPYVALLGGVGYEDIKISNRDALRDANGDPVRDAGGRFVTDPASPRRLSYDQDGLIWDVGVLWRPNPRLSAEFRLGHRYGSMSYTGTLVWQPTRRTSLSVVLFDSIDSFGRMLNSSLANLGTNFYVIRNPFSGDLGGCVFNNGQAGGACFNDTLSGISAANFRNRGLFAQFARITDPWAVTAALGYSRRKFIGDDASVLAAFDGLSDDNYFAYFGISRQLAANSAIDASAYANYFDSGLSDFGDVFNIGANVAYRRLLMRRLTATAALGIDSVDRERQEAFISLLAQIGLRYQF